MKRKSTNLTQNQNGRQQLDTLENCLRALQINELRKLREEHDINSIRKQKKRRRQKNYIQNKRAQGYQNLNFWLKCDIDRAKKIKNILMKMSIEEINEFIEKHEF